MRLQALGLFVVATVVTVSMFAAAAGAATTPLVVTITAVNPSLLPGQSGCAVVHVVDAAGNPVAGASVGINFSKVPHNEGPPAISGSPTDTSGQATLCFALTDLGEYDVEVVYVLSSSVGYVTVTSNTAVFTVALPPPTTKGVTATAAASAATVKVGDTFTLTVSVQTTVASPVDGYRLLIDTHAFDLLSATTTQGNCTGVLVCDFGTIQPGSSITVSASLRAVVPGASTIQLSWLGAPGGGAFVDLLTKQTNVTVTRRAADLAVGTTATGASLRVGDSTAVAVTVTNNGPDAVSDATAALTLPAGWFAVSTAAPDGASCSGTPLTCTLPPLASGASVRIVVTLRALRAGRVAFAARAASSASDASAANNAQAVVLTVARTAKPLPARKKR